MSVEGTVSFMGLISHAGNLYQGFLKREFVVSAFIFDKKTYVVRLLSSIDREEA